MNSLAQQADPLVDTHRTFGAEGPVYRVIRRMDETHMRVVVIESGEELDYRIERCLADPKAE